MWRLTLGLAAAAVAAAQTSVLTYHNDNARTGRYPAEILLKPANVKAPLFGKRDFLATDGAVYAQPLYVSRVKIAGKGWHNVLIVATAHDSLYAFDADDETAGAQPLWKVSFLDAARGVTTASAADVGCPVIPELGVTGTPAIDAASGAIYLIAETKEAGAFVYRLHAIELSTGAERPGSPVEIQAPGFVAAAQKQRTGLLVENGVIYSSWSGHCDLGTYHGLVMAHDAATLELLGVFNDTPQGTGGSFWNGGAAPSADAEGNVYVVSANGNLMGASGESGYDESVLKLAPAPQFSLARSFTPYNRDWLDENDLDLGSSGVVVLPDETGSTAHPHLMFTSGKEGRMYLLDRDNPGGAQFGSDSGALASVAGLSSHATFGMAAYFNGSIYLAPEHSPMLAFPVSGAALALSPAAKTPDTIGALGATPGISSDGSRNGIVWVNSVDEGGTLRAYDAAGLNLLYDSNRQPADGLFSYTEFAVPTVADGKAFIGNFFGVAVYGELPAAAPSIAAVANAASFSTDAIAPGSLASLFGSGLAPIPAAAPGAPLPLSLADVSVTINGLAAPLLYISPGQINAQVPFALAPGPAAVVVRMNGKPSPPFPITIRGAAPGLFHDAAGQAAALDADGSRNSAQNPAAAGSLVSVFFTGQGATASPVDDGAAPPAGPPVAASLAVSATVGGAPAEVQFAGLAPGFAGLAQINLKVPALASGAYPVAISIAGASSNSAQLVISAH
jgi:uncharacterized protein (TIGR03437 family)